MKEFIFGGCLAIWILFVGLSTLDIMFFYLIFIFPIIVAGIAYNLFLLKRVIRKKYISKNI